MSESRDNNGQAYIPTSDGRATSFGVPGSIVSGLFVPDRK
jgi:hypothetical protein